MIAARGDAAERVKQTADVNLRHPVGILAPQMVDVDVAGHARTVQHHRILLQVAHNLTVGGRIGLPGIAQGNLDQLRLEG